MRSIASAALCFGIATTGSNAIAQEASDGVINAKSYQTLKRGTVVMVEPEEDTDLNLRLRPVIAKALRDRGYKVANTAPVRFIFNADTPETRRFKTTLRRSPERGSRLDRDPRERSGPINNPLIRQGLNLGGEPIKPGQRRHLVNVIVLHEAGSQYWVGTASVDGRRGDSYDITVSLARSLVRSLGSTIVKRPIDVN